MRERERERRRQREGYERGSMVLHGLGFVERETLRVRSREITLAVCGFSYVQEVTMVNESDPCTWRAKSLLLLFFA